MTHRLRSQLMEIYSRLFAAFGKQHWWPGETPFEIAVGAILTQNTNWGNVEKAIKNLKNANLLSHKKMLKLSVASLADLIRPAGYFRVKAKRLINFLEFLDSTYNGDILKMRSMDLNDLRNQLLSVNGIGPETADSIILYAVEKSVFVVDSYTKRIFSRHLIVPEETTYYEIQQTFTDNLPQDINLFNEYHALIVKCGKLFCKPNNPKCSGCPLDGL